VPTKKGPQDIPGQAESRRRANLILPVAQECQMEKSTFHAPEHIRARPDEKTQNRVIESIPGTLVIARPAFL